MEGDSASPGFSCAAAIIGGAATQPASQAISWIGIGLASPPLTVGLTTDERAWPLAANQLAEQVGVMPDPLPLPWKPNSVT